MSLIKVPKYLNSDLSGFWNARYGGDGCDRLRLYPRAGINTSRPYQDLTFDFILRQSIADRDQLNRGRHLPSLPVWRRRSWTAAGVVIATDL